MADTPATAPPLPDPSGGPYAAIRAAIRAGRTHEALAESGRALAAAPGDALLWQLRAVAIRRSPSASPDPEPCLRRALALAPTAAGAWAELCIARQHRSDGRGVDRALWRALLSDPANDAVCALALRLHGTAPATVAALRALRPDLAEHHHAAAVLDRIRGRDGPARDGFRRTLCLEPGHGGAIRQLDRDPTTPPEARDRLRWLDRLAVLSAPLEALWLKAGSAQPSLLEREEDGAEFARRQRAAILALLDHPGGATHAPDAAPIATFASAYWGIDNTDLVAAAGRLTVRRAAARFTTARFAGPPAAPLPIRRRPSSRPSVGIVTAHGFTHAVWTAVGSDWVAHLAGTDASVTLYDVYGRADAAVARSVDATIAGPRPVAAWVEAVGDAGHDILLYPEIGMDPTTMTLAALRLAPLQVAGWGHPTTSGLATVDRYLSAERFETADADAHYVERLIRLPGVGVRVRPDRRPAEPLPRAELGLGEGEAAVALTQSVFKYTPAFDALLARIARAEPSVRFLVFAAGSPDQVAFWRRRVATAFAAESVTADRVLRLLPRMPMARFRRALATMDAYLDPPDFSGYNTGLRALETGCPLVTLEGPRLRHRLAAGLLREAGLGAGSSGAVGGTGGGAGDGYAAGADDLGPTGDADAYMARVLRLVRDPQARAAARAAQRAGLDRLTRAGDGSDGRPDLRAAFLRALDLG